MKKILIIIIFVCGSLFAQDLETTFGKQTNSQLLLPIIVTVGGDFVVTGSFTAFKSQRVDHFITTIFATAKENVTASLTQIETIKQVYQELDKYPLRDITLKRVNGEVLNVDLLKFRLTGDFMYNPYLMNDDVIIFPSYDDERNFIDIAGAVNKPVKFQFVEGDKLSDAILFGGGLNPAFDNITEAEISRLSQQGQKEEVITAEIPKDFTLQRGDRIRILFNENDKKSYKVLVLGEVNSPGYIFVTKNSTTLKELLTKSGGFTQNADIKNSELLRGTNKEQLLKIKLLKESFEKEGTLSSKYFERSFNQLMTEEFKMLRTADVTVEDSASFLIDNYLRVLDNQSAVDFSKINSETEDANFIVQDGDVVLVPQKENVVYVFGQVINPGYFTYQNDKNWEYYLNKAGGKAERADSDVKVIKRKNKTWISVDNNPNLEPGDFIYVLKDVPRSFDYYLRNVGAISSVITAVATLILIVIQASK